MARQHSRSSREYASREYTTEKPRRRSQQNGSNGRRDSRAGALPQYNHNGHEVTKGLHPDGESGRKGFNPIKFFTLAFKSSSTLSMMANFLWPVVPVAIALVCYQIGFNGTPALTLLQHFAKPEWELAIFITNYIAMVPAANTLGFAGQELSRKMPQKDIAVVMETTLGSVVEIILFMVLLKTDRQGSNVPVIRAAILGSILANLLLCLGTCFIAGGIKNNIQEFHEAVSESGSGLMLVAASESSRVVLWVRANITSGTHSASCIREVFVEQP
jgi:Ca2+:H+ antiporter